MIITSMSVYLVVMLVVLKVRRSLGCVKMSLVHDLAESIVGDLTPFCGVSKEEKRKREKVHCMCTNCVCLSLSLPPSFSLSFLPFSLFLSFSPLSSLSLPSISLYIPS